MKQTLPVEYLGEPPAVRTIDEAIVFVVTETPDDPMRAIVSLLELGDVEERPVLLVGATLSPRALMTLQMNAKVALVVPVKLDRTGTDELVRVSGAKPVALAAPMALEHSGRISRIFLEERALDLWTDPLPPKPEAVPEEPVERVREDWVALALAGSEPVRRAPLDERIWLLATKLAEIERRVQNAVGAGLDRDYTRTPPAEPSELTSLEVAIDGRLPENYVAFALRLAASVEEPNFHIHFPYEPTVREFADRKKSGRAVRIGGAHEERAWIAFGGHASGKVLLTEVPSDHDDEEGPMGRPREDFLAWIEAQIDLSLRMSADHPWNARKG